MIQQLHLLALIYGAAMIWAALLVLDGTKVTTGLIKPCGTVVGVLTLCLLAFDKWLWSWRWFQGWLVDRPYLKGTWKGKLFSTYIDPATNQPWPPVEVYLVIRQNYSAIHLRLLTKESSSESLANNIPKDQDGLYSVASIYRNTPKLSYRGRSPIHHGGLLLRVEGEPVASLRGEYWTDRLSQGEVDFTEKSEKLYADFDSAAAGVYSKRGSSVAASQSAPQHSTGTP